MKILGIDQSLTSTGWTVLDGAQIIESGEIKVGSVGARRLVEIRDILKRIIKKHNPTYTVREDYAYGSSGRATFSLGELGGIVDALCYDFSIKHYIIPNTTWKKVILGKGSIKKDTAYLLIFQNLTGLSFSSDNVADSYGLAKCLELFLSVYENPKSIYNQPVKVQESLFDAKGAKNSEGKKLTFTRAAKEKQLHLHIINSEAK